MTAALMISGFGGVSFAETFGRQNEFSAFSRRFLSIFGETNGFTPSLS